MTRLIFVLVPLLALQAALSACSHVSHRSDWLSGVQASESISIDGVLREPRGLHVDFTLTNATDRTLCLYRDALSPSSVFNHLIVRDRRGELLPFGPDGFLDVQDLTIIELAPGQHLRLATTTLLHDISTSRTRARASPS